jgi:hypothetical protein
MNTTIRPNTMLRKLSMPLVAALLGVFVLGSALLWQQQHPRLPPADLMAAPMPVSAEIEARYGVRITMVAATAEGGLIDLRYTVIDPDKAALMTDSLESLPVIAAGNGTVLTQRGAAHRHGQNLKAGVTYFLLYTNTQNAVRAGDELLVKVGELHLDHVPVR